MNEEQLLRYSRQLMLPEFDVAGQQTLLSSRVMIVGLGGLGSPVSLYLAAAGVGSLLLVDDDTVDASNLQRQVVHREANVGQAKVGSAAATLREINSDVHIETIDRRLTRDEYVQKLAHIDLVIDGTDNFSTRYELNEACFATGTPLVSGAAIRWEGQVAVFDPRDAESPCYRCLYAEGSDEALNCSESGVIAPLVGIIGTVQALEAIKVLTNVGEALTGALLYLDGKRMEWRRLKLPRQPDCPTCGSR